jgi:hypothetical protein
LRIDCKANKQRLQFVKERLQSISQRLKAIANRLQIDCKATEK